MNINSLKAGLAYADALAQAGDAKGSPATAISDTDGPKFADLVRDIVGSGIESAKAGELASIQAAAKQAEVVDIVTAVANAELTLETVVAVRDQVVQAYQDIIRMPI